ncbi:MAG: DUF167 domain-containing protein [Candidatus Aenigmarchaeota archaeon]|nr:DUF167 domain-containing protein [Candidatus Aenigmarchaeota archaeon]
MKKMIEIIVKTEQPEFRVEEKNGRLIVFLRSKPENNQANLEIVREFRKIYKFVKIVRGFKSKHKTLIVEE